MDREARDLARSDDIMVSMSGVASALVVPLPIAPQSTEKWCSGVIKWYDPDARYGFVIDDATGDQIFLHRRAIIRSFPHAKHIDLIENQKVQYTSQPPTRPGGRDEVVKLKLTGFMTHR